MHRIIGRVLLTQSEKHTLKYNDILLVFRWFLLLLASTATRHDGIYAVRSTHLNTVSVCIHIQPFVFRECWEEDTSLAHLHTHTYNESTDTRTHTDTINRPFRFK